MSNMVQYIILNEAIEMTAGKAAAQAAHASVLGYKLSMASTDQREEAVAHMPYKLGSAWHLESNAIRLWEKGGHYAKVVLGTSGSMDMVKEYLGERGFNTALVIDEGRTEIDPFTPTAIGVEILDKDDPHVRATFGEFKLYSDPRVARYKAQRDNAEARIKHLERQLEEERDFAFDELSTVITGSPIVVESTGKISREKLEEIRAAAAAGYSAQWIKENIVKDSYATHGPLKRLKIALRGQPEAVADDTQPESDYEKACRLIGV